MVVTVFFGGKQKEAHPVLEAFFAKKLKPEE